MKWKVGNEIDGTVYLRLHDDAPAATVEVSVEGATLLATLEAREAFILGMDLLRCSARAVNGLARIKEFQVE